MEIIKKHWKWILVALIILMIVWLIVKRKTISVTGKSIINKIDQKNEYSECIEKNKSLSEGAPCTNCIPSGSQIASYRGIIKNGNCELAPQKECSNLQLAAPPPGKKWICDNGDWILK